MDFLIGADDRTLILLCLPELLVITVMYDEPDFNTFINTPASDFSNLTGAAVRFFFNSVLNNVTKGV